MKTPPKQATNPLQFVKVGPCSLYRTAQEQLQKVQEVKKIKQEVRDDPEDWQSVSNFKVIILLIYINKKEKYYRFDNLYEYLHSIILTLILLLIN